jgi:hypothetical protein
MQKSRKQARATAQNLDFNSASVDCWNRARRPNGSRILKVLLIFTDPASPIT